MSDSSKERKREREYQLEKVSYFYADKIEDFLAYFKRELSFGLNTELADSWSIITDTISELTGIPIAKLTNVLNDFMERIFINLPAFSFFLSALQLLFLGYKNIYFAFFSREDKVSRSMQFVAGGAAIALVTVGILVAAGVFIAASAILLTVGSVRGLIEHTFIGATNAVNRYLTNTARQDEEKVQLLKNKLLRSQGTEAELEEYTKLLNKQAENNCRILNRINASMLSTTFLIGSVMLFTPIAPVGALIIKIGTWVAIADAVVGTITKKNTTRWIAEGVNALCGLVLGRKPFNLTVRTKEAVLTDLAFQTNRKITIQPNPVSVKPAPSSTASVLQKAIIAPKQTTSALNKVAGFTNQHSFIYALSKFVWQQTHPQQPMQPPKPLAQPVVKPSSLVRSLSSGSLISKLPDVPKERISINMTAADTEVTEKPLSLAI